MISSRISSGPRLLALFAFGFIGGCAASAPSVTPVVGPEGQSGYLQISCPGDHKKCRELANESCPNGFDIEDFKVGSAGARYEAPDSLDENFGSPDKRSNWLISCRNGKP